MHQLALTCVFPVSCACCTHPYSGAGYVLACRQAVQFTVSGRGSFSWTCACRLCTNFCVSHQTNARVPSGFAKTRLDKYPALNAFQAHKDHLMDQLEEAEVVCQAIVDFELDAVEQHKDADGIMALLYNVVDNMILYRPFLPSHLFVKHTPEADDTSDGKAESPMYACGLWKCMEGALFVKGGYGAV